MIESCRATFAWLCQQGVAFTQGQSLHEGETVDAAAFKVLVKEALALNIAKKRSKVT